ncbi:endocuticle structural protein SgAbd-6-like [Vanessa atalanta]|uniref:endocuticle structural protein SgAbd-6-like n=1 Tax=Vanessa atalanta TaxID=42275 RepID=UPI001FCD85E8|nr:endocuticle structural protein SgAbd-6-like [Vanessa atalanta]
MKLILVLCLVALAVAAPPPLSNYPTDEAQLLRFENEIFENGGYGFSFEQSDGQTREEQGELRNVGTEDEYTVVKGSYSWVGPDGVKYIVRYIADENGFQPEIEEGPGGGVPPAVVASLLG